MIESVCNTKSEYRIEIHNEKTGEWETIHEEKSGINIHEVMAMGMSINIPSSNLDKILTWISSSSITGIYRSSITNSKIQMNMIEKLRVVVKNPDVWKLRSMQLSPKALANNEEHSKGIFSNIPVKFLRS